MNAFISSQLPFLASRYVAMLGVKVTASSMKKSLESNPYYPAMRCLTTTFQEYTIPCNAFKLKAADIDKVPIPFLSFHKISDTLNDFVLVTALSDTQVTYGYEEGRDTTVSRTEFDAAFQGYIFVAEAGPRSGEDDYETKRSEEKLSRLKKAGLIAGGIFILFTLLYANREVATTLRFILPFLLKTAGCVVTIILLLYEVDRNNALVRKICESDDDDAPSHCDAVLNSGAAKIFGMSWAEIGFFFFGGTTLILLLPGIAFEERFLWLSLFSACAAPFILFSVYYQWRVVKQCCKLCLTTQAILAGEFICYMLLFRPALRVPELLPESILFGLGCLLLPMLAWFALRPAFSRAIEARHYKPAYYRIKNNPDYFSVRMQKQPPIPQGSEALGFVYGNAEGNTTLTFVSNPYCKHCAEAHAELETLMPAYQDLNVRMLFPTRNRSDKKTARAVKHIMAIAQSEDPKLLEAALHEWFSKNDYEALAVRYPKSPAELDAQGEKLEAMHNWCMQAGISHTPAFYLNGIRVPEDYSVKEILRATEQ